MSTIPIIAVEAIDLGVFPIASISKGYILDFIERLNASYNDHFSGVVKLVTLVIGAVWAYRTFSISQKQKEQAMKFSIWSGMLDGKPIAIFNNASDFPVSNVSFLCHKTQKVAWNAGFVPPGQYYRVLNEKNAYDYELLSDDRLKDVKGYRDGNKVYAYCFKDVNNRVWVRNTHTWIFQRRFRKLRKWFGFRSPYSYEKYLNRDPKNKEKSRFVNFLCKPLFFVASRIEVRTRVIESRFSKLVSYSGKVRG
ncbi:hypothetical protein FACS1894125_7080 [Actinomycetota bacterium]|nr:hypothetical protein FACS1894125_7080 [Actinomycetota bacterium]